METKGINLPVFSAEGKEIERIELNASVFDGKINTDAIHQAVNAFRANQRLGLASTKTRGEVSGGGRKPWRQKGTGRARVGSIRSPLWRHGGVVFGPHPRDFHYRLPQKIKALALKSSLNEKIKENNIIVVDSWNLEKPKTKEALNLFLNLKVIPKGRNAGRVLLLLNKVDDNLRRASRNISFLCVNQAKDTNAYEVLAHQKLIITRDGLSALIDRLK